jgi:hypothetical protein
MDPASLQAAAQTRGLRAIWHFLGAVIPFVCGESAASRRKKDLQYRQSFCVFDETAMSLEEPSESLGFVRFYID